MKRSRLQFNRSPLRHLPLPLILATLLLLIGACHAQAAQITDYRVVREPVTDRAGKALLVIRRFSCDGVPRLLAVDPVTLSSYDIPADSVTATGKPVDQALRGTRLSRALKRYNAPHGRLQNAGAVRAEGEVDGLFLTVDLCPSKRPFELEMFQTTAALCSGSPVPVAIAVTGMWLGTHPEEVAWLKEEIAAGRLAVTWVNHSYHHHYDPKVPLEQNFLLTPGTDQRAEVLELERQLLSLGLVPSPFFRFPGLVSDRGTLELLAELSLIPIGSDAWLAKGEKPRRGSFILVHGNGNEPKGIKLLLPLLRSGELHLLPLPLAFGPETDSVVPHSPPGPSPTAGVVPQAAEGGQKPPLAPRERGRGEGVR